MDACNGWLLSNSPPERHQYYLRRTKKTYFYILNMEKCSNLKWLNFISDWHFIKIDRNVIYLLTINTFLVNQISSKILTKF